MRDPSPDAALDAVQALHQPREREQVGADPARWCVECQQSWPCSTQQAILAAMPLDGEPDVPPAAVDRVLYYARIVAEVVPLPPRTRAPMHHDVLNDLRTAIKRCDKVEPGAVPGLSLHWRHWLRRRA